MVGIIRYGSYVPLYRLGPGTHGWTWPTTRAVANYDEDSITMGVAAANNCLGELDRNTIDAVFFATTTPPYLEKQCASIIAEALDLRDDIYTLDICNCLRSGTMALKAAIDTVKAGTAKQVLVVAADNRQVMPQSPLEPTLGDGAAAILVGDGKVVAELDSNYETMNYEFFDTWRVSGHRFVNSSEDRLRREAGGVARAVPQVYGNLLKRCGLSPGDLSRIILSAPNQVEHRGMMAQLAPESDHTKVQESLYTQLGNTGTAMALMMLVDALESGNPGERIVLLNHGNGADAWFLTVTKEIARARSKQSLRRQLERGKLLEEYFTYLLYRGFVEVGGARSRPAANEPSPSVLWRERDKNLRLHGSRCRRCGDVQLPPQRICVECHSKDDVETYRFSSRKGVVFTYSLDVLTPNPNPPVPFVWADIEGGGKIMLTMTDVDATEVRIGMPVEFSFRNVSGTPTIENYYWKFVPCIE